MSGTEACICTPRDKTHWRVMVYKGNRSYFNRGPRGSFVSSDYSQIECTRCRHIWRTKAKYVDSLLGRT